MCDIETKYYINRLLELKALITNADTGARIDSGTLPTITVTHEKGTTVTGTPTWLTGGTGVDPTVKVEFTPNLAGTWTVAIIIPAPYNAEQRFKVRVFA